MFSIIEYFKNHKILTFTVTLMPRSLYTSSKEGVVQNMYLVVWSGVVDTVAECVVDTVVDNVVVVVVVDVVSSLFIVQIVLDNLSQLS